MGKMLKTRPLHERYGVIVEGVDLAAISQEQFAVVRDLFERHSALLFQDQDLDDAAHRRLALMFGPLENRPAMAAGADIAFEVPAVSNERKEGGVSEPGGLHTLNLQANMLWHTDSTFLPVPALVNILTAKVVPSSGGQTQLASTRAAWEDMPKELRSQLQNAIIWNRYSHSRTRISVELGNLPEFRQWPDRPWRAIWTNPVTGQEALYIASHSFAIEGMGLENGQRLIDEAIEFCTQPQYVYSHEWQVGDVLIWDERCMLHRGQPWPYEEPRTLKSICCSATDRDGLEQVRVI